MCDRQYSTARRGVSQRACLPLSDIPSARRTAHSTAACILVGCSELLEEFDLLHDTPSAVRPLERVVLVLVILAGSVDGILFASEEIRNRCRQEKPPPSIEVVGRNIILRRSTVVSLRSARVKIQNVTPLAERCFEETLRLRQTAASSTFREFIHISPFSGRVTVQAADNILLGQVL